MRNFLLLGLLPWVFVMLDFTLAWLRRRSTIRTIFVVMATGWPAFILREMHLMHNGAAIWVLSAGMAAGVGCAFILLKRWVNNPGVLD